MMNVEIPANSRYDRVGLSLVPSLSKLCLVCIPLLSSQAFLETNKWIKDYTIRRTTERMHVQSWPNKKNPLSVLPYARWRLAFSFEGSL